MWAGGTFFFFFLVGLFGNGISDFSLRPIFISVSPLSVKV